MKIILSERLKELREENGMTQKQIAAKLGISSVAYLRYENLKENLLYQCLQKLQIFLMCLLIICLVSVIFDLFISFVATWQFDGKNL